MEVGVPTSSEGGKVKAGDLSPVLRPQLVDRLAHDFRRTAVRNLVRAGVPESHILRSLGLSVKTLASV